jgi:rubrerythrin/cation transport regulator ChaB
LGGFMLYQNTTELPSAIQKLPRKGQLAFKAVFNREYAKDQDEARALKAASEKVGATIGNLPVVDAESCLNKDNLSQSCVDEANAAADYRARADVALLAGDTETASLYEETAEEEDGHYNEFANQIAGVGNALKALKAAFNESDHPRANDGEFTNGGGGDGNSNAPNAEPKKQEILKGSDKQIAWANQIKDSMISDINNKLKKLSPQEAERQGYVVDDMDAQSWEENKASAAYLINKLKEINDARFFINNRYKNGASFHGRSTAWIDKQLEDAWAFLNPYGVKSYAVKFYDEEKGIIEGLGIPYGGPFVKEGSEDGRDIQGEFFNQNTDFRSEFYDGKLLIATKAMPELYHHGLDSELKSVPIGEVLETNDTPDGKWVKAQLDKANKYYEAIKRLVKAGALRWSSGALPEGVVKTLGGYIEKWPWIEMSLTPMAANPLAVASFKSLVDETINKMEVSMPKAKAVKAEEKPEEVKPVEPEKKTENGAAAPVEKPEADVPEAAEPKEAVKHSMKCAKCGKAITLPQPVVDALNALDASIQDILTGGDGSGETDEAAPSQPAESQGMSPENHVPPKQDAVPEAEETPAEEAAEPPAEQTPAEEKKPIKTATPDMKALFDDMTSKITASVKGEITSLKERVEGLEKQPVKGPPIRDVKAVTNTKMGDTNDDKMVAFYDDLLKDPNISPTTRMEIARKSAMLSLDGVIAEGPQKPRHN